MRGIGTDYFDLQIYVGLNPGPVLFAHYDKPPLERLGKIAALAQTMLGTVD
jgi:hypothetical protein